MTEVNAQWHPIELDESPLPRSGHSAWTHNRKIYFYGGLGGEDDVGDQFLNIVSCYDGKNWVDVDTTGEDPEPTFGHSLCHMDDNVYVYGGQTQSLQDVASSMHVLDMKTFSWREIMYTADRGLKMDRWGASANQYKDSILFFGGASSDDTHLNDVMIFNPSQQRFTLQSTNGVAPSGRRRHGSVLHDNRLLIIGGGREDMVYKNDFWLLHIPTWTWLYLDCTVCPLDMYYLRHESPKSEVTVKKLLEIQKSRPKAPHCACTTVQPRTGLNMLLIGTSLFVISGFSQTTKSVISTLYGDVHRFDLLTCTWERIKCYESEDMHTNLDRTYDELASTKMKRRSILHVRDVSTGGPIGRSMGCVEFDADTSSILLFGGRDNVGALGDLRKLQLTTKGDLMSQCLASLTAAMDQQPQHPQHRMLPSHLIESASVSKGPKKYKVMERKVVCCHDPEFTP